MRAVSSIVEFNACKKSEGKQSTIGDEHGLLGFKVHIDTAAN